MRAFLIVNPRSGDGGADELLAAAARARASRRTSSARATTSRSSPAAPTRTRSGWRAATGRSAPVAEVAIERDLPFACIPFGTRNHFARDIGLDRNDPIGALDALVDGDERRIDVGRANDRLFLNNVSLGVYARLVAPRASTTAGAAMRSRGCAALGDPRHAPAAARHHRRRRADRGARRARLEQRVRRSTCSRSASASGSTRAGCTSTRRTGVLRSTGTSGTASVHGRRCAPAGCTPRSTVSRRSSRRRSSSASSRARYACSCRVAQLRSTSSWPGKAISAGSSSRANQRSSSTSSAGDRLARRRARST